MLDDETDKQIKEYLKSISDKKCTESEVNGSCHYIFNSEKGKFHVRFANHFSSSGEKADFDIVKVRDLYIIRFGSIQYSLYHEDALSYIKAFFLIGPELSNQLADAREQTAKAMSLFSHYKDKFEAYQNDIKFFDDICDTNSSLEKENNSLKCYKENYDELKNKYKKCTGELKKLQSQFQKLNSKHSQCANQLKETQKELEVYKTTNKALTQLNVQYMDEIKNLSQNKDDLLSHISELKGYLDNFFKNI